MSDPLGGDADADGTNGVTESVALRFRWRHIGDVHLDATGKLAFPQVAVEPAVYRFEVDGSDASVYFGEASDLRKRFGNYRRADPTMGTNYRLRGDLTESLAGGGRCRVSVAEVMSFDARSRAAELDPRLKAARVLIESSAIVMARNDGVRTVLNLDRAYDRLLGGD